MGTTTSINPSKMVSARAPAQWQHQHQLRYQQPKTDVRCQSRSTDRTDVEGASSIKHLRYNRLSYNGQTFSQDGRRDACWRYTHVRHLCTMKRHLHAVGQPEA